MHVMSITVNETAKAFKVNGVIIAKRHIARSFSDTHDLDKALSKYLTIVPFLSTSFNCPETASEHVKYGAFKAKRLYAALGLNDENVVPFMLMCVAQSGEEPTVQNLIKTSPPSLNQFGVRKEDVSAPDKPSFFNGGEATAPTKPTLH